MTHLQLNSIELSDGERENTSRTSLRQSKIFYGMQKHYKYQEGERILQEIPAIIVTTKT